MKRLAFLTIAILAIVTAAAHQPATMRNGYDHYPLRGDVRQMKHYTSIASERDGALVPDTISHAYTMSLYEFNREGNVVHELFFRTPHHDSSTSARKECDVYYVYDEQGNWIKLIALKEIDGKFRPDMITVREIVYYE